ncbi:substrate-binding domain-containing protein [Bradyrhizobium erythrophlei]|jgi:molybdate transport system substrate-binding protein|uniref:Molybdenum ABC transporter, molybdate-binding protein n=1 Tax=Bradyrhizobium erythrophlei TaxID=1437360 RepID=A0A1M7UW69_9BRAD|nr:substrate-binding domain-containing protein [Bradyrhizobium erythrophlei]SHN87185.1 molybdenum ABC transporter, molybdate-binding protein [Bradyrhizobium erythrophlei]
MQRRQTDYSRQDTIEKTNEAIRMTDRRSARRTFTLPALVSLSIASSILWTPARADTLKVMAAGSLRAAMTDLLQRFPRQSDEVDTPEFGASGLMRQKIEGGAAVDVFASADLEQPHKLAAGHPERLVILFARNSLCALARPGLALNETSFLDRLLDPAVRIATSTPGSDPLGTYSWEVFARADAVRPGARATLEAKAKKLVGGGEKTPPLVPGKGAIEGIFLSDQADVMLIYCSAVSAVQKEVPSLTSVKLPPTLSVEPADGLIIINSKPVALRFVAFVMSEEGQATLQKHGLEPIASVGPRNP